MDMKSNQSLLKILILVFSVLILLVPTKSYASHIAGADISYQCLGGDSFLITINVFRDCNGIGAPTTISAAQIDITSPCGTITPTFTLTNPIASPTPWMNAGTEISQLCPSLEDSSRCRGGNLPGMAMVTFEAIVVLPPCNFWTMTYEPACCRNNSQNLQAGAGAGGPTVTATLNNSLTGAPCNNSPSFQAPPIPYVCLNQQVVYNFGTVEPDGDSLVYTFINAMGANAANLVYTGTNTATNPIAGGSMPPGATLDPNTGEITFIPTIAGNWVFAIQVNEYRNGVLIGTMMRDILIVVITCTNNVPTSALGITNFTGTGTQTGPFSVEVCVGQSFSFDVNYVDTDLSDVLTATTNIASVLPGAVFLISYPQAPLSFNEITVTVGWNAQPMPGRFYSFFVRIDDEACPIPGFVYNTISVEIIKATSAGPDQVICIGDTTELSGFTDSTYFWSVISPPPPIGSVNFSCDTCPITQVWPIITTTYELFNASNQAQCKVRDTVTIVVADSFSIAMHPDTIICFDDSSLQLSAIPSLANTSFTYAWNHQQTLDDDSSQFPIAIPVLSKQYIVTVTSAEGCIKQNSVNVGVTPPFPPNVSATSIDSIACLGLNTQLDVSLGATPSSCGLTSQGCQGPDFMMAVGSQNLVNGSSGGGPAGFPAPYSHSARYAKHQFIISSSELRSNGIRAGKLLSLGFDVANLNGGNDTYSNYEIRLGCTNDSNLVIWRTGLSVVFNPKSITIGTGWTEHLFDNLYDYDGSSHLIVQVCYANVGATSQNASTRMSTTSFNSAIYFESNSALACQTTALSWTPMQFRPNMRFSYCESPDPLAFNYRWFPTTNLNDSLIKDPTVFVTAPTTYFVEVVDTFGKCRDTASVTITLASVDAGSDTIVCPQQNFQLNGQVSQSCQGNFTVYWTPNVGLNNDSILNPTVILDSTQTYVLTMVEDCGCTVSDTITITVQDRWSPIVRKRAPDCNMPNGEFELDATGGFSPFTYSIDSGLNYSNNSLFDSLDIGYYYITMIDSIGCPSDTLLDTLYYPGAPFIDSVSFTDVSCYKIDNGTIEVFASGGFPPYLFSIDSATTFQPSNLFLNLPIGKYKIYGASADTCLSFPYDLEIIEPDLLEFTSFSFYDDTCFQLFNGYAESMVVGGTRPYTYNWSHGLPDDSTSYNLCAGTYTLNVIDAQNCPIDSTFVINEPNELVIDSVNITPVSCNGFNNGKLDIYISGGTPNFLYSINNGVTFSTNTSFDSLPPAFYNIVVKDNFQCNTTQQYTVREPSKVEVNTTFDSTRICVSTCTELTALAAGGNGGPYSFSWVPNLPDSAIVNVCPTTDMSYAVFSRDHRGCTSDPKIVEVNLYDPLSLETTPDTFTCSGDQMPLYAVGAGGDGLGYSYTWSPLFGLTNPLVDSPMFFFDKTQTYTVTLSDNCGSPSVSKSLTITVNPTPEIDITSDLTKACEPAEINFYGNTNNAKDCYWSFGNGDSSKGCLIVRNVYRASGNYDISMKAISSEGCEAEQTLLDYIEIYRTPVADFIMDPEVTSVMSPEINFTDLSTGAITKWLWNFGSLDNSILQNPKYSFPNSDTGTYPVKLTVVSPNLCEDDTIHYVRIKSDFALFVPSAFTPTASPGLNDLLRPVMIGVRPNGYLFQIYDRWGTVVFETNNIDDGWNGNINGSKAPVGQYIWRLFLGDYTDKQERHTYSGQVLIIK